MCSHLAKSFLRGFPHRPATAAATTTTTLAVPQSTILKGIIPSRSVHTSLYKSASASPSPSHDGTTLQPTHPEFTQSQPPPRNNPIDTQITNLPLVQSLRQNPSYKESRPHLTMSPSLRQSNFVAGSLSGSGKVTIAPYMWISKPSKPPTNTTGKPGPGTSKATSVFHIGPRLCGHPGFVHGGLLGVMLDEVFSRCISASFPSGLGMTANLNIDYRKPALPDRLYVLTAETVRIEGRKAYVEGKITMLPDGEAEEEGEKVIVTEGKALFVEPKFAEVCNPQVDTSGQCC